MRAVVLVIRARVSHPKTRASHQVRAIRRGTHAERHPRLTALGVGRRLRRALSCVQGVHGLQRRDGRLGRGRSVLRSTIGSMISLCIMLYSEFPFFSFLFFSSWDSLTLTLTDITRCVFMIFYFLTIFALYVPCSCFVCGSLVDNCSCGIIKIHIPPCFASSPLLPGFTKCGEQVPLCRSDLRR